MALLVARVEQTGAGGAQVGVVVPGMADPLPGSLGQAFDGLAEQGMIARNAARTAGRTVDGTVARSSFDYADRTVGREQAGTFGAITKMTGEGVQHADLAVALPEVALAFELPRGHGFHGNERIADGAHAANPRSSQQCRQNLGEDVGVFVGIEVSHVHTSGLKLPDLCGNFSDQLVAIEASQGGARGESG